MEQEALRVVLHRQVNGHQALGKNAGAWYPPPGVLVLWLFDENVPLAKHP